VNVLCDNALLNGYALGRKEIDTAIVREVAEDLSITTNAAACFRPIRQVVSNTHVTGSIRASSPASVEVRSGIRRLEPKPAAVKPIPKSVPPTAIVPADFLNELAAALTDAMGPMAKIVLRDQIKLLGESFERFPHAKLDMLLGSVSREILDEGMRAQFQHQILEQIRTLQIS
jgi:hypothetical protein